MLDLSIELIEWLCEPLAYVLLVAMCFSAIRLFAKILFKRSVFQKCSLFLWQFVFLMVLAIFIVSPWYWLWLCLYKNALFKVLSWLKIPYERVPWIKRIADKEFPTALVVIRKIIDCFLILGCFPFSVLVLAVIKYYKLADDFWLFNIKFNKGRKNGTTTQKVVEWEKTTREDGSEFWRNKNQTAHRMSIAEREYYDSAYYQMTHKPYWNVEDDKGAYGEYLIWKELRWVGASSDNCKLVKFLFNAYIPKENGSTSELDVIMLCPQGVFVFESKNYSGWIFGREYDKNWTQTLPVANGEVEKYQFYNPVMQNKTHIDTLKRFLKRNIPIWNVVVFSERCDLKTVEIQSKDVFAIQRGKLYSLVDLWIGNRAAVLSESEIEKIYQFLYPFTQVSDEVKNKHSADANRFV